MSATPATTIDDALAALAKGQNRDPFAVLGPHPEPDGGTVIRAFQPAARSIEVRLPDGELRTMTPRDPAGLFETVVAADVSHYRLRVAFPGDHLLEFDDPYRYGRVLTDFDLHLLGEGRTTARSTKLGAHRIAVGSTTGIHFAVWAPNADRVSVIADFNSWDGRVRMRCWRRAAYGRSSFPTCPTARNTSSRSARPRATSSRRAIPTASRSRCRPTRPRSFTTSRAMLGRRRVDGDPAKHSWLEQPMTFTRCTSDRGRVPERATGS
jgi:hypothetical protein